MANLNKYETEAQAWISAKPLLAVAIGIVIGFFLGVIFT